MYEGQPRREKPSPQILAQEGSEKERIRKLLRETTPEDRESIRREYLKDLKKGEARLTPEEEKARDERRERAERLRKAQP